MAIFSFTNIGVSALCLYVAYRAYWECTIGAKRRAIASKNGCLPVQQWPGKGLYLGFDLLLSHIRIIKAHTMLGDTHEVLANAPSNTLVLNMLGKQIFMTNEPENVKAMLATNFDLWSIGVERIKEMSAYLGHGIFTTEGATWKHSRETLRPCFERSQVADVSILEKHTNTLIDAIPRDGSTVDLQHLFHQFTLDVATEFLFGESTNSLDVQNNNPEVDDFIEAFEFCLNPLVAGNRSTLNILMAVLGYRSKRFNHSVKTVNAFADKMVDKGFERHAKSSANGSAEPSRYVFLDELILQTSDRIKIRAELLNILLAGRDTTAALLSNVWFEMSKRPDIVDRLRQEIDEHVGNEQPSYQALKDMKYLRAILNESQRLYPIVPMNSREALVDTVLPVGGGKDGKSPCLVPKGSYCTWHSYSMHRRQDFYGENADEFEPSRWLDAENEGNPLRPGWAYLPFNGGPRICIGQQFALTEASYITVRLLQTFRTLESKDPEPWRESITLTCTGLGGCKVVLS